MQSDADGQWCSWCYAQTNHAMSAEVRYLGLHRGSFTCNACGKPTTTCRVPKCTNMARIGENDSEQFCATHGGVIGSFPALSATIKDPSEITDLLKRRDDRNVPNLLKKSAITLGSAIVAVPIAVLAAPAVGGAVGVGFLGLGGAAAKTAGLAYLGFGSLASGGLGMAGGIAAVTAVGTALGGTLGGVVANRYFSEVAGFKIENIRDGKDPALLCVDGFLTEGTDKTSDWLNGLGHKFTGHAVYRVHWESQRLHDLGFSALHACGGQAARHGVNTIAAQASKAAAGALWPVTAALGIKDLAGNPWWVALHKSEKTGVLIAEAISRCVDRKFILIGHSLGARASVAALKALATQNRDKRRSHVIDAHLLGGAADVGDEAQWRLLADALDGKCYNYYSRHDDVLRILYRAAHLMRSTPIGLTVLPTTEAIRGKVISIDCSDSVKGHCHYHRELSRILRVEKLTLWERLKNFLFGKW